MVRACTANARDSRVGAAFRSTTTTGTPRRARTRPAIRPVGPAPTTSTSVSIVGRSSIAVPFTQVSPRDLARAGRRLERCAPAGPRLPILTPHLMLSTDEDGGGVQA